MSIPEAVWKFSDESTNGENPDLLEFIYTRLHFYPLSSI